VDFLKPSFLGQRFSAVSIFFQALTRISNALASLTGRRFEISASSIKTLKSLETFLSL